MSEQRKLLVIGASSKSGTELIRRVSDKYSTIIAHYSKSADRIQQLVDELGNKIVSLQVDLNDIQSAAKINTFLSKSDLYPDHVVHMASPQCRNVRFHQSDTAEFAEMLNCSVTSFVEVLRPIIKNMNRNRYGKIVVMLTAYTENIPPKYLSPYVTAKYALLGLVKSIASEYADKGITINAVSPEMMDTDFLARIPRIAVAQTAESNPMGRLLNVSEVIPTFEYLLSTAADRITGQNILITGVR